MYANQSINQSFKLISPLPALFLHVHTVPSSSNTTTKAEQRLAKVSAEAAEAQAAAAAARAAGRELMEKATSSARDSALRRDEVARLTAELERSRAASVKKVVAITVITCTHFYA